MKPIRVYVAGPYSHGDSGVNTNKAVKVGDRLLDAGMAPFIPHLFHFWHTMSPHSYDEWLNLDLAFLETCHILIRLDGDSPGADKEVELAHKLYIPVFLESALESVIQFYKNGSLYTVVPSLREDNLGEMYGV